MAIYAKIDGGAILTRSSDDEGFDLSTTLADGFAPFVLDHGSWTIDGVVVSAAPVYAAIVGGSIAARDSNWDGFDLPATLHEGFEPFDVPSPGWLQVADGGIVVVDPTAAILVGAKSAAKVSIDQGAGDARASFPSAGALVDAEYYRAEAEARAFAAAGYAGAVPYSVQSWADARGWTAKQAANDIIATADGWNGVLDIIRAARLAGKAAVDAAADLAAVEAARNAALATLGAIRPA